MPADCEWPGGCASDPDHEVPDGVPVYHLTKLDSDEIDGDFCRIHARMRIRQMGRDRRAAALAAASREGDGERARAALAGESGEA